MSYLLDTCVLSEYLKKRPDEAVISWLSNQENNGLFISILTIGELKKGMVKIEFSDPVKFEKISGWIKTIETQFRGHILPIDERVINVWAEVCGVGLRNGEKFPVIDSLIAATSIFYDVTLVTRNVKDFSGLGVKVFNPWEN